MKAAAGKTLDLFEQTLSRRLGKQRYELWFTGRTRFSWDGATLTVGVPNRHFEEWLQKTFGQPLTEAAREAFGKPAQLRFVIDPALFQAARKEQTEAQQQPAPAPPPQPPKQPSRPAPASPPKRSPSKPRAAAKPSPAEAEFFAPQSPVPTAPPPPAEKPAAARAKRARRWHKLNDFVVGASNRVSYASALSVVEAPGEAANPLVLYGPTGTGKTHLLEGIYAGVRRTHPDAKVMYLTSEDFTNRFLTAMRLSKLGAFRKQFRDCDVLLVDDLHFLATRRATQEEFLHTFDSLVAEGRQVVVTLDCHPRLGDDFPPELTDRLLGGAVWGLVPPDPDTRLSILRHKSLGTPGAAIPDAVLSYLASQLRGNVRELEGAVHSVRHYSRVTNRPVDIPLVREALADLLKHAVRVVHLADIDRAVCAVLRLQDGALQSAGRAWAVSHPRMVAMYLARKHTAASHSDIGRHFGGRNHSTVVAAEKKVRQWVADDGELALGERRIRVRELVERVERALSA